MSELLADDQPYRWVFRVTDVVAACCLVLAARRMRGHLIVVSVLVFAVATLADTVLSLDCAASVDALCRQRETTGSVSLGHRLHQVTSVLTFGSALVAAAGLERSSRRWHARTPGAELVQRVQLLTVAFGLVLGARVLLHAEVLRATRSTGGGGSSRVAGSLQTPGSWDTRSPATTLVS